MKVVVVVCLFLFLIFTVMKHYSSLAGLSLALRCLSIIMCLVNGNVAFYVPQISSSSFFFFFSWSAFLCRDLQTSSHHFGFAAFSPPAEWAVRVQLLTRDVSLCFGYVRVETVGGCMGGLALIREEFTCRLEESRQALHCPRLTEVR